MAQEIEYREDFAGNFRLLNFATGGYMCTCRICGKHFTGDKRAAMCLACAIKLVDEKFTASNTQIMPCCPECGSSNVHIEGYHCRSCNAPWLV